MEQHLHSNLCPLIEHVIKLWPMVFIGCDLIQEPTKIVVVAFNLVHVEGNGFVEPVCYKDSQHEMNLEWYENKSVT